MDVVIFLTYAAAFYVLYRILDYFYRIPKVGSLQTRYILVTGCDTGFGHEISKRLDKQGCHVFAACLTESGETELKKACSNRLKTVHMNVSQPESVRKAFDSVKRDIPSGSGLWGLINNAGISGKVGPVEWLQIKDYKEVFDVNLHGLIDTTVTFLPLLKKAKGRIVNTASVFGRFSLAGSTPYSISKFGVEAFSDALRRQLRDFEVSVHLIEPGFHKTNITNVDNISRLLRQSWDQCSEEIKQEYGEEFVEQSITEVLKNFIGGVVSERIQDVVDAYEYALLGLYPRARYVVGKDAKYVWLPIQAMPEWMGDGLLRLLSKNRPIPRALKMKQ